MLYTTASEQWTANRPLTPAQTRLGLYRTRDEARQCAEGRPTLAVAVRYDSVRGTVVATPPASLRLDGAPWSAPAFLNDAGGIVALCPIPPALVKRVGPPRFQIHSPEPTAVPAPLGEAAEPVRAIAGQVGPRG